MKTTQKSIIRKQREEIWNAQDSLQNLTPGSAEYELLTKSIGNLAEAEQTMRSDINEKIGKIIEGLKVVGGIAVPVLSLAVYISLVKFGIKADGDGYYPTSGTNRKLQDKMFGIIKF